MEKGCNCKGMCHCDSKKNNSKKCCGCNCPKCGKGKGECTCKKDCKCSSENKNSKKF